MAPSTSTTECSRCPDPGVVWIDGRLLCGACALLVRWWETYAVVETEMIVGVAS